MASASAAEEALAAASLPVSPTLAPTGNFERALDSALTAASRKVERALEEAKSSLLQAHRQGASASRSNTVSIYSDAREPVLVAPASPKSPTSLGPSRTNIPVALQKRGSQGKSAAGTLVFAAQREGDDETTSETPSRSGKSIISKKAFDEVRADRYSKVSSRSGGSVHTAKLAKALSFTPSASGRATQMQTSSQTRRQQTRGQAQQAFAGSATFRFSTDRVGAPSSTILERVLQRSLNSEGSEAESRRITRISLAVNGALLVDDRLKHLETFFTVVTLVNLFYIGASTDLVMTVRWPWIVADSLFASVFTAEELVKIYLFGWRSYILGPSKYWNFLYTIMNIEAAFEVCFQTFESLSPESDGHSTELPIARALRLARMLRVLRACNLPLFADLKQIFEGAVGGMRTFMWSLLILGMPLYLIALIFRVSLGDVESDFGDSELFATLPRSFFTSFRCMIATDCTNEKGAPIFVLASQYHGWGFAVMYCFLQVFFTVAVFNVIAAIFVENTLQSARSSEMKQKRIRLTDASYFERKSAELITFVMEHTQGKTQAEYTFYDALRVQLVPDAFQELLAQNQFQDILRDLDVSDEEQRDLFTTLDVDESGTLDLEELVQGISQLRGDARRSDIIAISLRMKVAQDKMQEFMEYSDSIMREQVELVSNLKQFSKLFNSSQRLGGMAVDQVDSAGTGTLSITTQDFQEQFGRATQFQVSLAPSDNGVFDEQPTAI